MSHLLSAPLRAQSIGHMVHWRVRTEAKRSRRSGARRAVLTRLWKPCGTLQKREEEQGFVIPRNRTTRPAGLTYQSGMAWEPSPLRYGEAIDLLGSGTDPVLPRERSLAARRKEGLEGMPSSRRFGPLWGWTRSRHTPKGYREPVCAGGEDGGSQPRHRPHGSWGTTLCGGADSPRLATLEPAGQRAVPSSYEPSAGRSPSLLLVYRLVYRPEPVRHPSEYKTYSITVCDQDLYSETSLAPFLGMTKKPPQVPLGGSPIPRSLRSLASLRLPIDADASLLKRSFGQRLVDEVTQNTGVDPLRLR